MSNFCQWPSRSKLLDLVDAACQKDRPLFVLPMYYPLAYYTGPDTSIDPLDGTARPKWWVSSARIY